MKKSWLLLLAFILVLPCVNSTLSAQIADPVKWVTTHTELGNNEFELTFKAKMDKGWCIYSQDVEEGGPIPADFDFSEVSDIQLVGKIQEIGKAKEGMDPIFEMNVKKYYDKVTFKAKVKTTKPDVKVEIPLLYMSCDEEACVRLEEYFNFQLTATTPSTTEKIAAAVGKKVVIDPEQLATPLLAPAPPTDDDAPQEKASETIASKTVGTTAKAKPVTVAKKELAKLPTPEKASPQKLTQAKQVTKEEKAQPSNTQTKSTPKKEAPKAIAKVDEKTEVTLKEPQQLAQNAATKTTEETPKKKKKKKKKKKFSSSSPGVAADNPFGNLGGNKGGVLDPVSWSFDMKELGNGEYELLSTAKIDENWSVYSQTLDGAGPVPTSFNFEKNEQVTLLGDSILEEISDHKKEGFDKVFEMDVTKFFNSVTFKQKVKLADPNAQVAGSLKYMTCDARRCLPPRTEDFIFSTKASGLADEVAAALGTATPATNNSLTDNTAAAEVINSLTGLIQDCGAAVGKATNAGQSPWMIFLLGFLGGFAALLTPCVFPMIPLTVSFFTKQSKDKKTGIRNAVIYAISIIVIYVTLGFFVTVLFGPSTLNALAANPWFNLAFFAIFVIFAISFFGYFEITLPSGLVNKVSSAEEKGGLIGIFFMAFTLALVSFSCTGPIIGTLLVEAAVGGKQLGPIMGMTGFAVALALPFALFAAFPGWLNSLPRSGGWLNTVKVILGFIELIFALKFLSNADLVQQWGLLKREIFLAIWIVLLLAMALYLIGRIKFPHDSPIKKLSYSRIGLAVACLLGAVYLVPGMFCKSLPMVSGFPPPIFYSINCGDDNAHQDMAKEGGEVHFKGIQDLKAGMELARKENKPVLIDFTGWSCVNCRKMEENVWPEKEVAPLISQYTLVSLYVDQDINLPTEERFTYDLNGKKRKVRTVGDKWSYLETFCFDQNTQPYYALVTPDGKFLNTPVPYTPDKKEYAEFLQEGLNNFNQGKTLLSDK